MPDAGEIKVAIVADVARFNAAMGAAKDRIAAMREPAAAAAAAAKQLAAAQLEVKKMTAWLADDLPHSNANLDRLARAQVVAALAARQLKAAQQEIATQAAATADAVAVENRRLADQAAAAMEAAKAQQAAAARGIAGTAAAGSAGASAADAMAAASATGSLAEAETAQAAAAQRSVAATVQAADSQSGLAGTAARAAVAERAEAAASGTAAAAARSRVQISRELKSAQADLAEVQGLAGGAVSENNALYGVYQEYLGRVNALQAELTATTETTTVAQREAANATRSDAFMMRYGTLYAGSYASGLRGVGFVIARLGAMSNVIFPAMLAALGAVAAVRLGETMVKWAQDAIFFKQALEQVQTAAANARTAIETMQSQLLTEDAEWAKINGHLKEYIRLSAEALQARPSTIEKGFKGSKGQAALDALHAAGFRGRTVINQLQQPNPLSELRSIRAPELAADIKENSAALSRLHGQLTSLLARANSPYSAPSTIIAASQEATAIQARIAAGEKLQAHLKQLLEIIAESEKLAAVKGKITVQQATKEAEKADKKAHGPKQPSPTAPLFIPSGTIAWGQKAALMSVDRQAAELAKAKAELDAALARVHGIPLYAPGGALPKQDLMQITGAGLATGTNSPESIARMNKALQAAYPIVQRLSAEMDTFFRGISEGLTQTIKGVQMGTESWSMAWRRMAANAALGVEMMWVKIIMKDIEGWAERRLIHVAGLAATRVTDKVSQVSSVSADAGKAGAAAYASVMEALPFPVNISVAPAIAAAAAAQTMTFAAFARGGIVPETGMAMVHQHEMVLPASISRHVMATAGGGGAGGNTTINVHALDGADAHAVLTRNRGAIATALRREMRQRGVAQ